MTKRWLFNSFCNQITKVEISNSLLINFHAASVRVWGVGVWSHGHLHRPSLGPLPHSHLRCCHNRHGTFIPQALPVQLSQFTLIRNIVHWLNTSLKTSILLWEFKFGHRKWHMVFSYTLNAWKNEFDSGFCNWIWSQVTTARKAVTLLLSYLIFTKPLTEQHGSGLLLIAMGIVLKLLPDNKPYKKASLESPTTEKTANPFPREEEKSEEMRPLVWNYILWLFLLY